MTNSKETLLPSHWPIDHPFESLFDDLLLRPSYGGVEIGGVEAAIEVFADEGGLTLKAELPGLGPDDVRLRVDGRIVPIQVKGQEKDESGGRKRRRVQRRYGSSFGRAALTQILAPERASAEYEGGVLTVVLPTRADR